jgi:proton-translocating NADH-quinone oxidoreductase chain N
MIQFFASGMSPLIVMVAGAVIAAAFSFYVSNRTIALVSLATIAATFVLLFLILLNVIPANQNFGNVLVEDDFAVVFQLIFLAVGLLSMLPSVRYIQGDRNQGEYYSLLLISVVGMMVISAATDLITLFVGIALTGLASASISAFRKRDRTGIEAAMKFYIISALSAAIALYGISLLYGITHTLQLSGIASSLQSVSSQSPYFPTAMIGLVMIIGGFGFEVAIVPFHMWAPDVYEGTPTPVSSLLSSGSKKAGLAAIFKIFIVALIAFRAEWAPIFGILAVLTMTVGNVVALQQKSFKRMLAYSSIGQAGYMLITLPVFAAAYGDPGIYGSNLQIFSISSGIFQILTHAIATAGAFAIVALMSPTVGGVAVDDFRGLFRNNKLLSLSMTLYLLSLLGIPLLAGFDSKLLIFSSAVGASIIPGYSWVVWLAVFGIMNSAVSLIYYVRVIRNMFSDMESPPPRYSLGIPGAASLWIALAAVVLIGVYPGPVIAICNSAARALLSLL